MKSLLNRTVVGLFRSVPVRAARHALFLAQSQPEISDRWGYHIRPIHYYEPLPDFRSITREQTQRKREYPAIDFRRGDQLRLLGELEPYARELPETDLINDYFSGLDAVVYYSLIRRLKPRRIIEIGGGHSTRVASKALAANQTGRLSCIEPYPEERLNTFGVHLITQRVEELDVALFSALEANDILFIDSSHTVKFGSDVCYEFLEILPALKRGVWVHVHDIFFPHDYPAEWLLKRRLALNEQYLLEAFLAFNHDFEITLSNYWLQLECSNEVARLWPRTNFAGARSACPLPDLFYQGDCSTRRENSQKPKVNSHEPKVSDHQPKVNSHEPKVTDHQPKVNSHEPKMTDHQPKVNSHEPKVSDHQPKVNSHEPKVNSQEPKANGQISRTGQEGGNAPAYSPAPSSFWMRRVT